MAHLLEMAFTDGISPEPTAVPTYFTPSHSDLAAVAATICVVGIFMALLVIWLIFHLRRAAQSPAQSIPISCRPTYNAYTFRPSFPPSEASPKFEFTRKPIRLSHRREDGSWDFADPDPISHPKESPRVPAPSPSPKQCPAPLTSTPTYTPRAHRDSTHKDGFGSRTPSTPGTPASIDLVEPPPSAYCQDSSSRLHYQPKDHSPF